MPVLSPLGPPTPTTPTETDRRRFRGPETCLGVWTPEGFLTPCGEAKALYFGRPLSVTTPSGSRVAGPVPGMGRRTSTLDYFIGGARPSVGRRASTLDYLTADLWTRSLTPGLVDTDVVSSPGALTSRGPGRSRRLGLRMVAEHTKQCQGSPRDECRSSGAPWDVPSSGSVDSRDVLLRRPEKEYNVLRRGR